MKILHIIPSLEPRYGGPSRAIIDMTMSQLLARQNVKIATSHFYSEKSFKTKQIKSYSFPSYFGELKISPAFFSWLMKNINKYDIVHIHSFFSFSSIAAAALCIFYSKPYIIRPAGQLSSYAIKQKNHISKKIFLLSVGGFLLRKACYIHVMSLAEKQESVFQGAKFKYLVLPTGIDRPEIVSRKTFDKLFLKLANKKYILYLGRIHPIKNIELVINSIAHSKCFIGNSDLLFLIAGNGDKRYIQSLKDLSLSLKIRDRIIFIGDVRGKKKNALLSNAEIFILLSHIENFGISVLEALAHGLPVIISKKVGLAKAILVNGAGQVVDKDITSVAKAIDLVLKNKKIASIYSTNGIRLVENQFQWDAITAKQISIYEKIHDVR